MRVLVSGGTGYAGRFIVEHLLNQGYSVTVGGRTAPAPNLFSKPVDFVPLALDPDSDQIDAFSNIYYFVHAAFDHIAGKYRGGEGDDPEGFVSRNAGGSIRLFEAARDAGVRRACFLSSRAVYDGQPSGIRLTEDMLCRPDTLYGKVKLQVERSLQALCGHSFVTASLRVTGIYGSTGPSHNHKWQVLVSTYLAGKPVPSRAGTEVHGDDVANAVRLMLEADPIRINGDLFNVSDLLLDNRDILGIVKDLAGCPHPLPETAAVTDYNVMDTRRIEALGWRPGGRQKFEETVRATLVI